MVKTLHVATGRPSINVKGCVASSSQLVGGVTTITCDDEMLAIAVLSLVESGVPASTPASYTCGPGGPLGEVVNLAPSPCSRTPLTGDLLAYCSDPELCSRLAREALAGAKRLRLARLGNAWVLEAKIDRGGYIDLGWLEEANRSSLKTVLVKPERIPPLTLKSI